MEEERKTFPQVIRYPNALEVVSEDKTLRLIKVENGWQFEAVNPKDPKGRESTYEKEVGEQRICGICMSENTAEQLRKMLNHALDKSVTPKFTHQEAEK